MPVINGSAEISAIPGPCDWDVNTDCVPNWDDFTPEVQARAITLATFVLDAFTGHQFSQCPITVRPCGDPCSAPGYVTWPVNGPGAVSGSPWMVPYINNGVWRNCMCGGGCKCEPACRADLRVPVASVEEVKVDGLVLDPAAYSLVGRWLARTDGGECWPSCQDPAVPDTEEGTFSVTFRPGRQLPVAGQIAAGALAGQFAEQCSGGPCALPGQLQSLTRQGVEVEMVSPTEVLSAGRTGVEITDLFIQAVNPQGMRQRPRVYSPDVRPHPVRYT